MNSQSCRVGRLLHPTKLRNKAPCRALLICHRQTADTFDAAATFFDLTHEWGTPEPEILKKIKFAKWNAARILKAIREGRDPNDTNPVLEERPETLLEDLAVQPSETPLGARAASVEDVPDAGEPPSVTVPEGYFPSLSATTHVADSFAPSPLSQSSDLSGPGKPPPLAQVSPVQSPDVQASLPPAPQALQKSPTRVVTSPSIPAAPPPTTWATIPTVSPPPGPATVTQTAVPARQIVSPVANGRRPDFVPDLKQAQRHARFAVSALDFDDVQAAIEQLREALNKLGAQ